MDHPEATSCTLDLTPSDGKDDGDNPSDHVCCVKDNNYRSRWSASFVFETHLRVLGLVYQNSERWLTPSKIFHAFIVSLTWANFLRYFAVYRLGEFFGIKLILKIALHIFTLLSAVSSITGTLFSRARPQIVKAQKRYDESYHSGPQDDDNYHEYTSSVRERGAKLALLLCWTFLLGSAGMYIIAMKSNDTILHMLHFVAVPMIALCDHNVGDNIVIMTSVGVNFLTMLFSNFQMANVCHTLTTATSRLEIFNRQFLDFCLQRHSINNDLRNRSQDTSLPSESATHTHPELRNSSSVKKKPDEVTRTANKDRRLDLSYWRTRHQDLCDLVQQLDQCFGFFVLLVFITLVPMCAINLYSTVMAMAQHHNRDYFPGMIILIGAALAQSALVLSSIIYIGTRLNTEATACKKLLSNWDFDYEDWDIRRSLMLTTFYHRVQEGCIGVTGWNLFYVNKQTAKVVVLMVVSYTLILLKFGEQNPWDRGSGSLYQECYIGATELDLNSSHIEVTNRTI